VRIMQPCDDQVLSAYLDDELDARAREAVEKHLLKCSECAAELDSLKSVSNWFSTASPSAGADIAPMELARVHDGIDQIAADCGTLRLFGVAGAIAASVLVVSGTWLAVLAASAPGSIDEMRVTRSVAPEDSWEQVATTLQVVPKIDAMNEDDHLIRLADARFADWMINSLDRIQP